MENISNNDLNILAKVFFPTHDHLLIYQNNKLENGLEKINGTRNVVALVDKSFPNSKIIKKAVGIISFNKKYKIPYFNCKTFHYINNPDGTIRWVYPSYISKPLFLKLYNSAGWRGAIFKFVFRIAFFLRLNKLIKSGTVRIFYKNEFPLDELLNKLGASEYAIFTGTVGDNRKAVVALQKKGGHTSFCKIPLTYSAEKLVQNEQFTLQLLNGFSFKKITVPQAAPIKRGILQSDVRPNKYQNGFNLQATHLEALRELIAKTAQKTILKDLPLWDRSKRHLKEISEHPILNGLSISTVNEIVEKLTALRASFDPFMEVPTSVGHGDFTPWNMYLTKQKLHVYDWELSERLPLLFDAFHFIIQSGVLVRRLPFSKIEEEIIALEKNNIVKKILENQSISFNTLYRLYLLKNISYYLLKYIRQKDLHVQAYWLLENWDGLLDKQEADPKYKEKKLRQNIFNT